MAEILTEFPEGTGPHRRGPVSPYRKYCDGQIWRLMPSEFGFTDDKDGQRRLALAFMNRARHAKRKAITRTFSDGSVVVQATPKP